MKTAEQQEDDRMILLGRLAYLTSTDDWKRVKSVVKKYENNIKLDAFKAGMTKAAELSESMQESQFTAGNWIYNAILTFRDNLTTLS